ncbi:MAG TPA: TolC family outer membrane protein [Xanthobacteraceae bacterium]|jgi:adhesin transport system outer membrane protein|nr:TolC family outer membrane protein [Xanthobacteraceae bacterium]
MPLRASLRAGIALAVIACTITAIKAGESFSITDAIQQAIHNYPSIGEATANRRATEAEMRQTQATGLPQVRLEARAGPERYNQNITPAPLGNNQWLHGKEASIVVRQLLFDGFATVNQIWRQAARVDAASARVFERTELVALDAAEAYINVVRYRQLVSIAERNVDVHNKIFKNIDARYRGGRSGEGDLQQIRERVENAQQLLVDFRLNLDQSRATYRKVVGLEPVNLRFPGRLPQLPGTRDQALAIAVQYNPTIRAAQADTDAAKYGFKATAGAFAPTVAFEGSVSTGRDANTFIGDRHDESFKLVASWDIWRSGQDSWARQEAAERWAEQSARHARLQRDAVESIDKAWSARTITNDRARALLSQIDSARRVVEVYSKEYDLGQRTLIDLLNAQNQFFNAEVSLISLRGVAVFADYQLLAAMGHLLAYLKMDRPIEAEPIDIRPATLFAVKLPPVRFNVAEPGPEPINPANPAAPAFTGWTPSMSWGYTPAGSPGAGPNDGTTARLFSSAFATDGAKK